MQFTLISDLADPPPLNFAERGLHYGDGLFETMLLSQGRIRFWPEHYQRLQQSADRLGIPCPPHSWLVERLQPYLELQQDLVLKLILTRGRGGRGLELPEPLKPTVFLIKYLFKKDNKQPVKACFSEITLSKNPNLAGLKHLNRLDYVLATQVLKQHQEFDEALLLDSDGHVIETIVHNLFFVLDDVVCTPDLSQSGVDGVMRQAILKSLIETGKNVNIGDFSKQDILSASECFLCNSVQGIRALIQLEQQTYPIGPVTQGLQKIFNAAHD